MATTVDFGFLSGATYFGERTTAMILVADAPQPFSGTFTIKAYDADTGDLLRVIAENKKMTSNYVQTSWSVLMAWASTSHGGTTGRVEYRFTASGNGFSGSDTIVETYYVPARIVPSISSITVTDAAGHKSTYGGFIQGYSNLSVSFNASSKYGGTIIDYNAAINGQYVESATLPLTGLIPRQSGTQEITVGVMDSRGAEATKQASIRVLDYTKPIIQAAADRTDSDGTPNQSGTHITVRLDVDITSLSGKNSVTTRVRYKRDSVSTWGSWATVSGSTYTFAASADYNWDVQIQATDQITSTTVTRHVPGSFVLVDYGGDATVRGTGLAFGGASTKANTFQNYLDSEFSGTSKFIGNVLTPVNIYGATYSALQFKTPNYTSVGIRAYDNSTAYGHNMLIQSGALLIMGSGEYPANRYAESDLQGQDLERTYIGSDNQVYIETNGNTIADRKTFSFGNGGDLWMPEDGRVFVDSSTIGIGETSQPERVTTSGLTLRDKNDNVIGNVYSEQLANGTTGFLLSSRRGNVYNAISLRVRNDGAREVYVDDPAAWRKALSMSYAEGDTLTFSGVATPCSGYITSSQTLISFFIPLSKPIESGVSRILLEGNLSIRSGGYYIRPDSDPTITAINMDRGEVDYTTQKHPSGVVVNLQNSGSQNKFVRDTNGTAATNNDALSIALASGFKIRFI